METDDLELVRLAAAGDRAAFRLIVDRHARGLFRLAQSLTKCPSDAEDVVQDALLAAYRGIGSFDGRSSLKTWLSRIVMKRSISAWRKNKRHTGAVGLEQTHEPIDRPGRSSPGSHTMAVDQRMDLESALPSLAPEYREIFVLREMQGLSYAEIGQVLGIPPGTVDSRLHRARGELRKHLKVYRS